MRERLGLRWGEVHGGAAELERVKRPVIEHFSKRRGEMLRAAQEGGIELSTKAAAQSAALATRDRKRYGIETHTWREEVRSCAAELGLGAQELNDLFREGWERPVGGLIERDQAAELILADHLAGPEGPTAKSNTFDERAVLQEFAAAARQGALASEVRERAERFAERPDVIRTDRGEMTTAELVDCERRLISGRARCRSRDRVLSALWFARVLRPSLSLP